MGPEHNLLTVRLGLSEVRSEADLNYGDLPYKLPDLLVSRISDLTNSQRDLLTGTDLTKQPLEAFKQGGQFEFAIDKALAALEVEFSPYKASEMRGRSWQPKTVAEFTRKPLKRANPPTAPNIFVKEEDLAKLMAWEKTFHVPIIVSHLFDQEAFTIRLRRLEQFNKSYESKPKERVKLQMTTGIFKVLQVYERVDAAGARERKVVFRVAPSAALKIGDIRGVKVSAQLGVSASKKYVAHTLFENGKLLVSKEFLDFLNSLD